MIIFGWGYTTNKEYGQVYAVTCGNCNNDVYIELMRQRSWFTFFFIPIFPYKSEHWLLCPICSKGAEIEASEDLEKYIEMSEITQDYINKKMSKEEYKRKLEKLNAQLTDK